MKFFFYGSLLRGLYNNYILKNERFIRESSILGNYVLFTYTSSCYPRLADISVSTVFHPLLHPNKIVGEVWDISEAAFQHIEGMELGAGYYRAVVEDDNKERVNVYFIKHDHIRVDTIVIIQNGDWREYLKHFVPEEYAPKPAPIKYYNVRDSKGRFTKTFQLDLFEGNNTENISQLTTSTL